MIFYDRHGWRKWFVYGLSACAVIGITILFLVSIPYSMEAVVRDTHVAPQLTANTTAENSDKWISLSFDDGPHEVYTPQLLDLLEREHVPATFFFIGEYMVKHPDIVRRVATSPLFEIGNHTFTHSREVHANERRLRAELSAADRVLRNITGHTSYLYRPPFLIDFESWELDGSTQNAEAFRWAEKAGFLVIGTTIDSLDWLESDPKTGKARLERRLIEGVYNQSNRKHNVVLLHEEAGSGTTLEALPGFIATMKAEGYTFVPISQQLGLTKADVMPAAPLGIGRDALLAGAAVAYTQGSSLLWGIISILVILGLTRMWTVLLLRFLYVPWARARRAPLEAHTEPVSVLIPAFNEALNIEATIHSAAKAIRPGDEIIVVDDGSTDETSARVLALIPFIGSHLRLLQKENEGAKAKALSFALPHAQHNIVVCIDADTIVAPDAITHLVTHFSDPHVGAVSGKIYPAAIKTLLSAFQYLEYTQGQNIDKTVFALGNAVHIVPGALGAWRKDVIERLGGYSTDTVVEDQDLTFKLLSEGFSVRYDARAYAFTETPHTVRAFFKQRMRWMYGTVQCVWKYLPWFASTSRPWLGFLVLPYTITFNVLLPMCLPLLDIALIIGIVTQSYISLILIPFLAYTLFDMLIAAVALRDEEHPHYRLLFTTLLLQRLFYRYLIAAIVLKSVWLALTGSLFHWGVQKRHGDCHVALMRLRIAPFTLNG